MKRWELIELKRIVTNFTTEYCKYKKVIEKGCSNKSIFALSIYDKKSKDVIIEFSSVDCDNINDIYTVPLIKVASAERYNLRFLICLKDLIGYLNERGIKPNRIDIECTLEKAYRVVIDGIVYIERINLDFLDTV